MVRVQGLNTSEDQQTNGCHMILLETSAGRRVRERRGPNFFSHHQHLPMRQLGFSVPQHCMLTANRPPRHFLESSLDNTQYELYPAQLLSLPSS